jgi:membrane-bound lytic murein transglycosylase B
VNQDRRGGEGVWLLIFLALLVGAKPAADAAGNPPPHHARPAARGASSAPAPSRAARGGIPANYLTLYRSAARTCPGLSWGVLAGIGKVESDHGRSRAPGVVSSVNSFGCCAGPMQFNIRNGPPSTWDRYGRGGNVYEPRDAIPAAARLLCANGIGDPGSPDPCAGVVGAAGEHQAVLAYNHACWYVAQVLELARAYQAGGGS